MLNISRNTVRKALDNAQKPQYIRRVEGEKKIAPYVDEVSKYSRPEPPSTRGSRNALA